MSGNHRAQFIAARDSRNRRIPGLYVRGNRYYAQLWADGGNRRKTTRRFPLRDLENQPIRTLLAAREALEKSLELQPDNTPYAWLFLAMTAWQIGEREEALKRYKQAVEWIDRQQ